VLCRSCLQVMQHMSKCFQAIGKLKLDTETPGPGQRPKALGIVSCVGEEYVPFKTPLPLVDKVHTAVTTALVTVSQWCRTVSTVGTCQWEGPCRKPPYYLLPMCRVALLLPQKHAQPAILAKVRTTQLHMQAHVHGLSAGRRWRST
jgi:hypothetical protein